jgi:hypothetical protein
MQGFQIDHNVDKIIVFLLHGDEYVLIRISTFFGIFVPVYCSQLNRLGTDESRYDGVSLTSLGKKNSTTKNISTGSSCVRANAMIMMDSWLD